MRGGFSLFLFALEGDAVATAIRAGVDGVVVDWESRGKRLRQAGADTEINPGTAEQLAGVRAVTAAPVICRINPLGAGTETEVEAAIAGGADEILVPMVRAPDEVVAVLEIVRGRCATGILVETQDAVECSRDLARLPLARVYVGLNDLAIDRGMSSIFAAVADGTVAEVRRAFAVPFGFAGLTLPELGHPVPCRLLIAEMARLGCSFSFLRRSYRRDVSAEEAAQRWALARIRRALDAAAIRDDEAVERDLEELRAACGAETGSRLRRAGRSGAGA